MSIGSLVWYSVVTVYVSIKGVSDIKNMLRRLKNSKRDFEDVQD